LGFLDLMIFAVVYVRVGAGRLTCWHGVSWAGVAFRGAVCRRKEDIGYVFEWARGGIGL